MSPLTPRFRAHHLKQEDSEEEEEEEAPRGKKKAKPAAKPAKKGKGPKERRNAFIDDMAGRCRFTPS